MSIKSYIILGLHVLVGDYELFAYDIGMEVCDKSLTCYRDMDPIYLAELFQEDFYAFENLWLSSMCNQYLVYDDDVLYKAVEEIEMQEKLVSMLM